MKYIYVIGKGKEKFGIFCEIFFVFDGLISYT